MPYADPAVRAYLTRCRKRRVRHGNWRQTIADYGFLCGRCGAPEIADLHEPFGEDHNGDGKMQARIPLCYACHEAEHGGAVRPRPNGSLYLNDIQAEMDAFGGSMGRWAEKYGVKLEES